MQVLPNRKGRLAVVWGFERMHLFLFGADEFDIYIDHKALQVIYNKPSSKPPAHIERWQLRLQNYSFRVIHRSGSNNPSDYMTRRHPAQHEFDQNTIAEEYVNFITSNVPKALILEEIKHRTKEDQTMQTVIDLVRSGRWNSINQIQDPCVSKTDLNVFCKVSNSQ